LPGLMSRRVIGVIATDRSTFNAVIAARGAVLAAHRRSRLFSMQRATCSSPGGSRELIIIRGANHYPQDIGTRSKTRASALSPHGGAAFRDPRPRPAMTARRGAEVERSPSSPGGARRARRPDPRGRRCRARHVPYAIALLRPGALPKTTSGKIPAWLSRRLWLEGGLDICRAGFARRGPAW